VLPEISTFNVLASLGKLPIAAATKRPQTRLNPTSARHKLFKKSVPAAGLEPALRFREKGF
jgi:hypothetical protein